MVYNLEIHCCCQSIVQICWCKFRSWNDVRSFLLLHRCTSYYKKLFVNQVSCSSCKKKSWDICRHCLEMWVFFSLKGTHHKSLGRVLSSLGTCCLDNVVMRFYWTRSAFIIQNTNRPKYYVSLRFLSRKRKIAPLFLKCQY